MVVSPCLISSFFTPPFGKRGLALLGVTWYTVVLSLFFVCLDDCCNVQFCGKEKQGKSFLSIISNCSAFVLQARHENQFPKMSMRRSRKSNHRIIHIAKLAVFITHHQRHRRPQQKTTNGPCIFLVELMQARGICLLRAKRDATIFVHRPFAIMISYSQ